MHYGLLETHPPSVPSYVSRVDYRGKGMTRRARDERRIDPRSLPRIQFDHQFQTAFHMDFYSSVILTRNPVVSRPLRDSPDGGTGLIPDLSSPNWSSLHEFRHLWTLL